MELEKTRYPAGAGAEVADDEDNTVRTSHMCDHRTMESIGLRELRQSASDYVKRAEDGEELLITVAGRPAAVLGPARRGQWRTFEELRGLFDGPGDDTFDADRALIDGSPQDPWVSA